jgi:hypothetical protein
MEEMSRNVNKEKKDSKTTDEETTSKIKNDIRNFQIEYSHYKKLGAVSDAIIRNGIGIVSLSSKFAESASEKVKEIVDELFLPPSMRKMQCKNKHFTNGGIEGEIPVKLDYQDANFNISIALPEIVEKMHLLEMNMNPSVIEENSVDL